MMTTKPCVNCGADQPADFRQYHGCLGYEAILCLVCGYIYDHAGAHEPDKDERSILYVKVDQDAVVKRRYLKDHGTRCPFCKSENIEGGHVDIDGGAAWQRCGCNDCNASWEDSYKLTGIEIIDSGDQAPAPADAQSQTIGG